MDVTPPSDPDGYLDLVRRAPMLDALRAGPLDRRDLEARLGVSRATSHRFTRWLGDRNLVERDGSGAFALTALGRAVAASTAAFKADVGTAFRLAPVLDAAADTGYPVPLDAFGDATVTTPTGGDPHAPTMRYATLVQETTRLRGFDTWAIAPTYMGEVQERILGGMETALVDPVAVVEDVMDAYPERCVEICVSGNLTIRLHDALPFGLALFDDRVGVAVRDPESEALTAFVDTADPRARAWADAVYAHFETESVLLEDFTRDGLRRALADR